MRYGASFDFMDDGPEKPVRIWSRIGRRPILAGGNSNGDLPMLRFGRHPRRLSLLIHHDDDTGRGDAPYDKGAEDALAAASDASLHGGQREGRLGRGLPGARTLSVTSVVSGVTDTPRLAAHARLVAAAHASRATGGRGSRPTSSAGISAGAVVVPQAMAYATIANLPVQIGLYTCIVPMLVYALLGGSRAMSVSTTSTIATLTATTLVSAGVAAGSDDALGSLTTLTLLVGAILVLARLLRLGSLVENISGATVLGLKIGVGATVAVGQLPKLLGETYNFSGHGFIRSLVAVGEAFDSVNWPTVWLSVGSIAVLVLLKRFAPRIPGTLVVVVGGILLVAFAGLAAAGVELIDPVPSGLPLPGIPDFSQLGALVPGRVRDRDHGLPRVGGGGARHPQDRRAADRRRPGAAGHRRCQRRRRVLHDDARGGRLLAERGQPERRARRRRCRRSSPWRSRCSSRCSSGPVLSLLPEATLASMVFVAVIGLIDIPTLVSWARISPTEFWIALSVALIGLTAGLLAAVAVGVVVTLILVLRELNKPLITVEGTRGSALALKIRRGLYTANVRANTTEIERMVGDAPGVHAVVLDLGRMEAITITVLDALADLDRQLAATGVTMHLAALPERAERVAKKVAWYQGLEAEGRVHATIEEGLAAAAARLTAAALRSGPSGTDAAAPVPAASVARHRGGEVRLDVDVGVIRDVEDDLLDLAVRELEPRARVHARDGIRRVVADAQALAAQREVAHHGADLLLGDLLVVDVELERPDALAVLAHPLLRELDADDVLAGCRRRRLDAILRRDAEEVVGVGDRAVLDEQRVAAEPRAVGEDDALGRRGEVDLGEDLVRDVVHVRRGPLGHLRRARVVDELTARRHRLVELHRDERLEVLRVADDLQVVQRQHVVGLRLFEPERLELLDLLGVLGGEVVRLGAVDIRVEQLPLVVVEARDARPSDRAP